VTEDEAADFIRDWWDGVWHKGDIELLDWIVADRYVQHTSRGTAELVRAELKERMVQYQRVLHGAVTTVDDHTVDGDTLWMRATSRGVNLETNSPSIVTWMLAYRFEKGRVVEGWIATIPDVDWTR
jgi:hypothetical protein